MKRAVTLKTEINYDRLGALGSLSALSHKSISEGRMVIYRDMRTGSFNTPQGWREAGRKLREFELIKLELDLSAVRENDGQPGVMELTAYDSYANPYLICWRFDTSEGVRDWTKIDSVAVQLKDCELCNLTMLSGTPWDIVDICRAELYLRFGNDDTYECWKAVNRFDRLNPAQREKAVAKFRKDSMASEKKREETIKSLHVMTCRV